MEYIDKTLLNNLKEEFKKDILAVIRDDEIGKIAKTDPTILMVGSRLYEKVKRRFSKKGEVQSCVRADMRRLSHLYMHFTSLNPKNIHGNAVDMFIRSNFEVLKEAIEMYTNTNEKVQKSGLKAALYYLISGSVKKCMGHYLALDNDVAAKELSDFKVILELRKDEVIVFIQVF